MSLIKALSGQRWNSTAPPPKNGSKYLSNEAGIYRSKAGISFDFPPRYFIIGFIHYTPFDCWVEQTNISIAYFCQLFQLRINRRIHTKRGRHGTIPYLPPLSKVPPRQSCAVQLQVLFSAFIAVCPGKLYSTPLQRITWAP